MRNRCRRPDEVPASRRYTEEYGGTIAWSTDAPRDWTIHPVRGSGQQGAAQRIEQDHRGLPGRYNGRDLARVCDSPEFRRTGARGAELVPCLHAAAPICAADRSAG